jgi:hypothetical protein
MFNVQLDLNLLGLEPLDEELPAEPQLGLVKVEHLSRRVVGVSRDTCSKIYVYFNPILHTWFRYSCFTCDGSSTLQDFPLLFNRGILDEQYLNIIVLSTCYMYSGTSKA